MSQKNSSHKNFLVTQKFGHTIFFKNFSLKKIKSQKIYCHKKFQSQKFFSQKKFVVPKHFKSQKFFSH